MTSALLSFDSIRYGRMKEQGMIDENGDLVDPRPRGSSSRSGEYCYCPECQRVRKQNKAKGSEARREQLRQWKLE
eukprot:gene14339-14435_t